MIKMKRFLSFGGGVQTTFLLFKYPERYKQGGLVFANTGDEKTETYDFIEKYVKPFCIKNEITFYEVKNSKWDSLFQKCMKSKLIPIRNRRWCTDQFKKLPIRRFYRSQGFSRKNPVHQDIGFSYDEIIRAENQEKNKVSYVIDEYPLVDNKITRQDCAKEIIELGFPVPVKSGCWYCPFARKEEWRQLKIKNPKLYEQACIMEEQNRKYPNLLLKFTKPLRQIDFNNSLDDYIEGCDTGYCMK